MQYEIGGVTNDSDEDVDVTKMDLGKSGKGPMNRFDFDNEDDYGEYMAKREALPKAAFQYGQKNRGKVYVILILLIISFILDRGRDITKGGKGGKNEKQKLDQQFQKIQNIMKKRDETRKAGGDYHKVNY